MYQGRVFDEPVDDYEGFVYLIENTSTGRKYIGKKAFWFRHMKRGKRRTFESDWRTYHGSNDELRDDVQNYADVLFQRTILHLCFYKKQMTFLEQKEQWDHNVLLTDDYYNTNIGGKFFVRERRIYFYTKKEVVGRNEKFRQMRAEKIRGDKNPAKRPEVRAKISEKKRGEHHHQYGKPITPEHSQKLHAGKRQTIEYGGKIFPSNADFVRFLQLTETEGIKERARTLAISYKKSGAATVLSGYVPTI